MHALLARIWYQGHWAGIPLIPLSWLFRAAVALRRAAYGLGVLPSTRLPVPVMVVGNIALGGTGKTPLVIWLAGYLQSLGMRPGVVSRGYGRSRGAAAVQARSDSDVAAVGDEPLLIARRSGAPVVVDADRARGALSLVEGHGCDVIISDDGLQHYRLQRDLEIVVLDGTRRHGNGRCLPAGPLREPPGRLSSVDLVVVNGEGRRGEFSMRLVTGPVVAVGDATRRRRLEEFAGSEVHAVCGIGNPQRFFKVLRDAGLRVHPHPFPDHHPFQAADLDLDPSYPILMTEKDAVKCASFAPSECWFVSVTAQLPDAFCHRLERALAGRAAAAAEPGGARS